MARGIARVLGLLAIAGAAALLGCSERTRPPEEAVEQLRHALRENKGELLYELMPLHAQVVVDDIEAQLAEIGPTNADKALRPYGVSREEWERLDSPGRFAVIFRRESAAIFPRLSLTPSEIVDARIADVQAAGESALVTLDDGKGHRTRLEFEWVEGRWRLKPRR